MSRKISLSPTPLAMAMLVSALFAAAPVLPNVALAAAPPTAASKQASVRQFTLKTGLADGKMVFLDAQGQANPTLRANVGDTVEIVISSGEGAQHDIAFPQLKVASAKFDGASGATKVRFKVPKAGTFEYICTIAGHRQIGMEGVFEVSDAKGVVPKTPTAATPAPSSAHAGHAAPATKTGAQKAAPAVASAVSVAMDPTAVPAPLPSRPPQLVKYRIETVELVGRLADGTTFTYWTFDKKVPGPMLRVRVGDSVQLTLANARDSKQVHSIDLHAVTGPGGGAEYLQVPPGKEKTVTFKALNPGLYVYHCATALVPEHISAGMYGLILVEPEGGLPKVDREFYVMQGDIYTKGAHGAKGHQPFSTEKLAAEQPDYYVFNGAVGALTKEHKMMADVGETVRIYFGVGGPNKISSFHVIGEIFDKVYNLGATNAPLHDVQTTLVAPGGAAIVEFKADYPGKYMLVDHALSRVGKGLVGMIEVTGNADPNIYIEEFPY
jgi:nitrite reductase (NO-forming)